MGLYGNEALNNFNILNEEVIYSNNKENILISIDVDKNRSDGFRKDPYIKIYNTSSYKTASKIARVSLKTGEYIEHKNLNGKENWILNSKEKKKIGKILNDKSTSKKYNNLSVLDAAYESIKNQFSDKYVEKFDLPDIFK